MVPNHMHLYVDMDYDFWSNVLVWLGSMLPGHICICLWSMFLDHIHLYLAMVYDSMAYALAFSHCLWLLVAYICI